MVRNYKDLLDIISTKKDQIVIRHDVDFDIKTARRMMEVEREKGLWSVIYVDVHSPSYTLDDIEKLYNDFCNDGFLFGIHINVAYKIDSPVGRFKQYKKDLSVLGNILDVHSCTGHLYSSSVVRQKYYGNIWLEKISAKYGGPKSFIEIFGIGSDGIISRCADSGGKFICNRFDNKLIDWLDNLEGRGYLLTHPVHYFICREDVMYTKKNLESKKTVDEVLEEASRKFKLSPYLSHPLKLIPHQEEARKCLSEYFTKNYDKLYTVVDVACGTGLLGTSLMNFNNVKYIGVDMNKRFIEAGKYIFNELGYSPQLIVSDFFKYTPDGNIMVLLGYEDCPIDYNKIYDIACKFNDVIITIVGKEMLEIAKEYGKHYYFISEEDFENMTLNNFDIVKKINIPKKRVFYWLRNKYNEA